MDDIIDIKAKNLAAKLADITWSTLDVRGMRERSAGSLEGFHIPLELLGEKIDLIKEAQNLIVYCRCGNRSITAIKELKRLGFKGELLNLDGGMMSVHRENSKQNFSY